MSEVALIKKVKSLSWEVWLYRKYPFLVPYLMVKNGSKEAFATQGIKGEFPVILYDSHYWYTCQEMLNTAGKEAEKYLKEKDIITLTGQCEVLYKKAKKGITKLLENKSLTPLEQYEKVIDLISPINVYVWVAHAAEEYYHNYLLKATKGIIPKDQADKFIGDIGFPSKKNAISLMEDDMRSGVSIKELQHRYAWMKTRSTGGFGKGYTIAELKKLKNQVLGKKEERHFAVKVPKKLVKVVKQVQELVYLRTLRTDVLFELYYLAAPIFHKVEKQLNIKRVEDYLPGDIIQAKIPKNPHYDAVMKYYNDIVVGQSIISPTAVSGREVRGVVAWTGKVFGNVRIVLHAKDATKVKRGDILVTNMTNPSYIAAMHKARAFVTDEGGITCHAAIIAREMKKPCIIGTKVATKIFKDGDRVEVDANKGIVKKL